MASILEKYTEVADPKKRESALMRQFAEARTRLGGQRAETERQSDLSIQRRQAITGRTGGSLENLRQKSIQDIGKQFSEAESGLAAEEAGAQVALGGQAEQARQFEAELEENKRTNLINAAIALNDAGLNERKNWLTLVGDKNRPGPLSFLFQERRFPSIGQLRSPQEQTREEQAAAAEAAAARRNAGYGPTGSSQRPFI